MMNNKHKGETILITVGLLMLAAALLLTGYNLFDEYRAGTAAEHILEEMRRQAPNVPQEDSPPCDGTDICEYVLNPDIEMPVINIEVEVLSPAAAEELLNEEWALTLFTCTPDGQNRVAVRCVKL